jgi:hypothetical protein
MLNKNYILASIVLVAIIATFAYGPIPQDPRYHAFADTRTVLGTPNGCNVLSNLPFMLVGAWGFLLAFRLLRQSGRDMLLLEYLLFFSGIFLTGIGSSFYHLDPSNASLVRDRLPMSIAFMALLSSVISESVSRKAGGLLLAPLLLFGLFSVVYWAWGENAGQGDLRPYVLVQFLTVLLIPLILLLFKPARTYEIYIWMLCGFYVLSKLAELFDGEIYSFTRIISGHTLKHVLAAAGTACVIAMLQKRQKKIAG